MASSTTQARLWKWLWHHSRGKLTDTSRELHITYDNARQAKSRLMRRRDLHHLCPECFRSTLFNLTCHNCGFVADRPEPPIYHDYESQSPVHSIQPLNGLGSELIPSPDEKGRLRLAYGHRNLQHFINPRKDPLLERAKSMLWEELKTSMLSDAEVEEATRLLVKETADFRVRYPSLVRSKNVANQPVENVLALICLGYPGRFPKRQVPLRPNRDMVTSEPETEVEGVPLLGGDAP